jgi:ribosomal-protein-alanine N-acetyltransferase
MQELAGPGAAACLAALHAAAAPAEAWDAAAFGRLLAMPGAHALATAAGFVLFRLAADEAEILMLAVLPEARRRGLGRRLVEAAAAMAGRRGARAMFLEVAAGNAAARALYAATGFVEVGTRPGYYPDGEAALVLRRALSACGR